MKIPLNYQQSEFDCVPVTFLNALNYLCEREEIEPIVIKTVYHMSLDSYDAEGNPGRCGTSKQAVAALVSWISEYSREKKMGISCKFLSDTEVTVAIAPAIMKSGVLLACIHFSGAYHYVLVTAMDESFVYLFDPYYLPANPDEKEYDFVSGQPWSFNRRVSRKVFFGIQSQAYALGEIAKRECVLMSRTSWQWLGEKA